MSKMSHYRGQSCSYLKDLEHDGSAPSIFPVVARGCLASIATPSAIEAFAEHPTLTRLVAAAEAGLGLWLALRMYSQEEE